MYKNFYRVYSQRLAGYLMLNGFCLLKIVEENSTGYNSFIFANNPELQSYVDKYKTENLSKKHLTKINNAKVGCSVDEV